MPESISFTYSCFFERIAERMTRALEQLSNQRTKDQAAREKELALWTEVFQAVLQYCTTGHALTSRLTAEPSHTNRGCDSMGMGERARTPDFRSCDYRKHDDRETLESEGTMLEAALSGLQVPPGLEKGQLDSESLVEEPPRQMAGGGPCCGQTPASTGSACTQ